MGDESKNSCPPRLLDLIPRDLEWEWNREAPEKEKGCGLDEEKQLELRLWPTHEGGGEHSSVFGRRNTGNPSAGAKRGFLELEFERRGDNGFEKKQHHQPSHENKACPLLVAAPANAATAGNVALDHANTESRRASVPIVGWPPVRSSRKNIKISLKASSLPQDGETKKLETPESSNKCLFLKINMDGVPIGRKIDLKAYKNYESLSVAVDELFKGLIAVQREYHVNDEGGVRKPPTIGSPLDGSGEYTLVYEDNDGDRILVGDVPWEMFVSTAKRLRVLKTSQLSTSSLASGAVKKNQSLMPSGGAP